MQQMYKERDKNLKELGFRSYQHYLYSGIWRWIRKRALKHARHRCESCRMNKATQVHHLSYSIRVLLGHKPKELVAVCSMCHEMAHGIGQPGRLLSKRMQLGWTEEDDKAALDWMNRF